MTDPKPRVPRLYEPCGMLSSRLLFVEAGDPDTWTKPEGMPDDLPQPVRLRGLFRDGI